MAPKVSLKLFQPQPAEAPKTGVAASVAYAQEAPKTGVAASVACNSVFSGSFSSSPSSQGTYA